MPFDETFAAVVFDMDGTLILSEPAIIRAWTTWAIEHGVTADQLRGFHGVPTADVVRAVLGTDRAPAAIERINALELAETDGIVPVPGSAAALAALPAGRAAIATSCSEPLARARLAAGGVAAPDLVITVDDVERGKPAPDIFLLAAERLGVDPADCLVVEDAVHGLAAAAAAGMRTLAVTTTTPAEDLLADAVVPDLSAVRFEFTGDGVRVFPATEPA
ncbi:HAD family hydrolase [Granulicoccus sp. GXG6511]|uniref:HAD family hydrolase n=1 Tax=Granulicoccus sp. GXG6511 TaxID=3381351 RepID=UPI003D7C8994